VDISSALTGELQGEKIAEAIRNLRINAVLDVINAEQAL
jgi:hypothetical protein